MQIFRYQRSKEFNRNEAIYVLHTVDGYSFEELSSRFKLAIEEIQKIFELHKQYELALTNDLVNEE